MGVRDSLSTGGKTGAKSHPWGPSPMPDLGLAPKTAPSFLQQLVGQCSQSLSPDGYPANLSPGRLGEVPGVDREGTGGG